MHSKIDHVGIVVGDLAESIDYFRKHFGLTVGRTVDVPGRMRAAFLSWGEVSLELIEVAGGQRPLGVDHLALAVPDLDEAIADVRSTGMATTTAEAVVLAGRRTIFVEPGGVVPFRFQLVESDSVAERAEDAENDDGGAS